MSILFVLPHWPRTSELWMERMIDAVADHISVIACFNPPQSHWKNRVPVIDLLPGWSKWAVKAKLPQRVPNLGEAQLRRALADYPIRGVLIHYAHFAMTFQRLWRQTDIPLFVHCHGFDVTWDHRYSVWPYLRRHSRSYPRRLRDFTARAVLLANSEFTKQRLLKIGIQDERVKVKYLGVPVSAPVDPALRAPSCDVLYLGRLVDFKGPVQTIQAFSRACELGFPGRLLIAGGGDERSACEHARAQSRYADRIELLGVVNAARGIQLRQQASLFTAHNCVGTVTNQEEAWGVSAIEAMMDGLPVITGRNGGVCESVVDGETGYLFEPGDIEAHAQALCRLAQDQALRERMGAAGRARAIEQFSIERERQELLALFGLSAETPTESPRQRQFA